MSKKMNRVISAVVIAMIMIATLGIVSISSAATKGLPDPSRKGSLTVHKFSTIGESQLPGSGLKLEDSITNSLGKPLADVGFTLYKVDPEFEMRHDTTVASAKANATVISEKITSPLGIAVWTELEQGYYVLSETTPPASGHEQSPDSIITLPMGVTESGDGWNYDIHVYPKNISTEGIIKEVVTPQQSYSVGDIATWKISGKIPSDIKNGAIRGKYLINDPLDYRLTYVEESEEIYATGGLGQPLKLEPKVDYEVLHETDNSVCWSLTATGIDKIDAEKSSGISVSFETTVNDNALDASPHSNMHIYNGAELVALHATGGRTEYSIADADKPSIMLTIIRVVKIDSLDDHLFLDGAEFKLATSKENAENGTFLKRSSDDEDIVLITGDNLDTSAIEKGAGVFTGIVSSDTETTKYYIVETKAPVGYILRQSVVEVEIEAQDRNGMAIVQNQKIGDPPLDEENPTFLLPNTGGIGTKILILLGVFMIITSTMLMISVKRLKKN